MARKFKERPTRPPTPEMRVWLEGQECWPLKDIVGPSVPRSAETLRLWCKAEAVLSKKIARVWYADVEGCELIALMTAEDREAEGIYLRSEEFRRRFRDYVNRRQAATLPTANKRGQQWDDWDDMIFEVDNLDDVRRAKAAERTHYGLQARKQKLRKQAAA